jgi:hypothetical protein
MKAGIFTLAFLLMTLSLFPANAQDRVKYKKKTVIDLSGATIEGELTKPEGSYIVNRKLSRFSSLIQARRDYIPELLASHNDL